MTKIRELQTPGLIKCPLCEGYLLVHTETKRKCNRCNKIFLPIIKWIEVDEKEFIHQERTVQGEITK